MRRSRTATRCIGLAAALAAARLAQATVVVAPAPSTSNFEAIYQLDSATTNTLTTTAPSGTFAGTQAFIEPGTSSGGDNNQQSLGFYYGGSSSKNGLASVVYDTNGTVAGAPSGNALDLGTNSANPNTFTLDAGSTYTYSVDFANNFHTTDFISLINPKAKGAGSTSVTDVTTGGFLGAGLAVTVGGTNTTYDLFGQKDFAGDSTTSITGSGGSYSTAGKNFVRLVLNITNNGSSETVGGFVYTLDNNGIGGAATPVATITPQTLLFGTGSGRYDINAGLSLEIGQINNANAGNNFYAGNISLAVPEPTSLSLLAAATGLACLRRSRRISAP